MAATAEKHGGGIVDGGAIGNRANRKGRRDMKRIEAVFRRDKLVNVKSAIAIVPHRGFTACDTAEQDSSNGAVLLCRGTKRIDDMSPRVSISVLVDETDARVAVDAIARAARTGRDGDGTIVVVPVEEVVHISGYAETA